MASWRSLANGRCHEPELVSGCACCAPLASPGLGVPDEAKPENMLALAAAAEEYGVL